MTQCIGIGTGKSGQGKRNLVSVGYDSDFVNSVRIEQGRWIFITVCGYFSWLNGGSKFGNS